MPDQRRGPVPLYAFAGQDHLVPSARRSRHPRRLARLPGLHRAAVLRLDGRQGHRLRRFARAGDRAHANRAFRNGGGGHPDQHSAAPRAPQRHALSARRRLHSLSRAAARAGREQEKVMPWLSLSVSIDAASADEFSDALLLAGAQSTTIDAPESALPTVSALLPGNADPCALVGAAAALCKLARVPSFELAALGDEDWVGRTQAQFTPLETARLWIGPTWHEPPREEKALVRLDPGLAFGTGSHPTTRLVLAYIERELRRGARVLDYGCGSGILAIAAAKLGARRADAADIDPEALEVARANAARNAVSIGIYAPENVPPGVYELVVANILADPLIVLAPLLATRTAAGGRIALCGILASQAEAVAQAYRPWFAIAVHACEEPWALVAG